MAQLLAPFVFGLWSFLHGAADVAAMLSVRKKSQLVQNTEAEGSSFRALGALQLYPIVLLGHTGRQWLLECRSS